MPYKNRENKIDAQRRNRQRKRERKEYHNNMNSEIGDFLMALDFDKMTLNYFTEVTLENFVVEEGVVIDKNTGEPLEEGSNVFWGWNMIVVVDNPRTITMPEEALSKLKELRASGE